MIIQIVNKQNIPEIFQHMEIFAASILSPVYWKDNNGTYLGMNQSALQYKGLNSNKDIIGKTDFDLWPNVAAEAASHDQEVMRTKQPLYTQEVNVMANGEVKHLCTLKIPLMDPEGKVVGILSNTIDDFEKNSYKNLEQQQYILAEKVKSLQLIGRAMAHDLRSPLAAINVSASALGSILPDLFAGYRLAVENNLIAHKKISEARLKSVENVIDNIKKGVSSANSFINFMLSNIQYLAVKPENMGIVSIYKCLSEVLDIFIKHEDKQLIASVKIDDFQFKGINALMIQVLANLLKTAISQIKAINRGYIDIWTEKTGNWNVLHLKDTGEVLEPDSLEAMFKQFFVRHGDSTVDIGLAFCKQAMIQFGGSISCDSEGGNNNTHYILKFPALAK